jgi:uncharacterized membrane protein YbhN (UPF0104 family)
MRSIGGLLPNRTWFASPATKLAARLGFAVSAIGLSIYAISIRWDAVSRDLGRIAWVRAAVSTPLLLLALLCGMLSWRAVLGNLGSKLPATDGARIYFIGQLGKYLPGSIWPVVAQMELGKDYEIPRRRSIAALLIAILVSLITGFSVAALAMPLLTAHRHQQLRWLLLAVPLLLPLLHPKVLRALLLRIPLLKLDRTLGPAFPAASMWRPVIWAGVSWVCYGLHVFVLAGAFRAPGGGAGLLALGIGGYALAWCAGMIAFLLPAGAGARDVVLVFALSAQLPVSAAVAVAVVSRAVSTFCDLSWAAIAAVGVRSRLVVAGKLGRYRFLVVDPDRCGQRVMHAVYEEGLSR